MRITWGDIGNIGVQRDAVNRDKYNELYTRYIMRKRNLMRDCINHMYYLTCDKNPLVELTYSGDGENRFPMLKFNKMEKIDLMVNLIPLQFYNPLLKKNQFHDELLDLVLNDSILFFPRIFLTDELFLNRDNLLGF